MKNVKPKTLNNDKVTWIIVYENLKEKEVYKDTFDAVIVANGHLSVPNIPKINGMKTFKGVAFHSHEYRNPEKFEGKTVCIVGAGPSGSDIANDVSKVAKKVKILLSIVGKKLKLLNNRLK